MRNRLTSDDFMMPKMGNKMAGSMAAIARGMTSVIQKTAISNKTKEHSASCTDTEAGTVVITALLTVNRRMPGLRETMINTVPLKTRPISQWFRSVHIIATNFRPDNQRKRKQQQRRHQDQDDAAKVPQSSPQGLHLWVCSVWLTVPA